MKNKISELRNLNFQIGKKGKGFILVVTFILVVILAFQFIKSINRFFEYNYLQFNQIIRVQLDRPLEIKKRRPERIVITVEGEAEDPLDENIEYDLDELVGIYADEYGENSGEKSLLRARLHCLLYKESVHNNNKGHGDGGMAGGPLQFWQDTYVGFRKIMIAEDLVDHIGNRYDAEDAIETAAWALTTGREENWGPINRGECL